MSRISGAVNLITAEAIVDYLKQLEAPPTSVVIYSAVGKRSVDICRELDQSDRKISVKNYTGSVFAWANDGLPILSSDDQTTKKIHFFEDRWARFLDEDLQQVGK